MPITSMRRVATLAMIASLAACSTGGGERPISINDPPTGPVGASTATLSGVTYRLEAHVWRDFMPGPDVGTDGRPLIAVARIATADGAAMPTGVQADSIWIINGGMLVQMPAVEEQPRASGATGFEVVARNGPRWGPGITVAVAVRLRDASGGSAVLRVAAPIDRTD